MKNIIYILLAMLVFTSCGGENKIKTDDFVTIEGVDLPVTLSQGGQEFVLNGAGVRSKFFMKVYVGGLYLSAKTKDAEHIIDADEPSLVRMVAISRAFTNKRMSETVREKFEESAKGNITPYQSRIDLLCGMIDTLSFKKEDYCDFMYIPNEGIRVFKNGKDLNVLVTGLDFKQVIYKNWLSEISPADESLRKGMLGID